MLSQWKSLPDPVSASAIIELSDLNKQALEDVGRQDRGRLRIRRQTLLDELPRQGRGPLPLPPPRQG